jgi:serine/threonine protein kinase
MRGAPIVQALISCLARNFNGLPSEEDVTKTVEYYFLGRPIEEGERAQAIDLVRANLDDKDARHLLIATMGDSALQILEGDIRGQARPLTVVHGSQFADDQSPDYSYRILSQIILCMERGGFVVLRDLQIIYGSLYDMLNQNYTTVGGKRNCRVALGADSNPMCHVADDFRCIVIMDAVDVPNLDPPFLNRFEKQCISYDDVLQRRPQTKALIKRLDQWVKGVSEVSDDSTWAAFAPRDGFLGFHTNTLPSLVLAIIGQDGADEWDHHIEEQCQEKLLWTATEDMIVRIRDTNMNDKDATAAFCEQIYYDRQVHSGFQELLVWKLQQEGPAGAPSQDATEPAPMEPEPEPETTSSAQNGLKLVVMTFSSVHESPEPFAKKIGLHCRRNALGAFKSESEFVQCVDEFWKDDKADLYVLQVNANTDAKHVLLAKSNLEERWSEYHGKLHKKPKHICIMMHVDREPRDSEGMWQFNFLSGWDQVTLDALSGRAVEIQNVRTQAIEDAFRMGNVEKILREEISTCFYDIGYPPGSKSIEHIRAVVNQMSEQTDEACEFITNLKTRVIQWLTRQPDTDNHWVQQLARNRRYLEESTTLANAVLRHMRAQVREPLAMVLFKLEELDTLRTYFRMAKNNTPRHLLTTWLGLVQDELITDISDLKPNETRSLRGYNLNRVLVFPFSWYFFKRAESFRDMFTDEVRKIEQDNDSNEEYTAAIQYIGPKYCSAIKDRVEEMDEPWFMENIHVYFEDVCSLLNLGTNLPDRYSVVQSLLERRDPHAMQTPMAIHVGFWLHGQDIARELRMIATIAADIEDVALKKTTIMNLLSVESEEMDQILLGSVCVHYLDQIRSQSCSLVAWHRSTYKIVSEAVPLGSTPPAYKLLRLCEEFTRVLCINCNRTEWPPELQRMVDASTAADFSDFFISTASFTHVWELLMEMEATYTDANSPGLMKSLQHFRLEFANRCLSEVQRVGDNLGFKRIVHRLLLPNQVYNEKQLDMLEPEPEFEMVPESDGLEPELEPQVLCERGSIGGSTFITMPDGCTIELFEEIGRGGSGIVHRGELRSPSGVSQPVAVKVLGAGATVREHEEFLKEVRKNMIVSESCEGVAHAIGAVMDNGLVHLVMELYQGNLASRLEESSLTVVEILGHGEQVLRSLTSLHRHEVAVLDLKPANLLFDEAGRLHIADFGIANVAEVTMATTANMTAGTPQYMAPEQFRPDTFGRPEAPADVWAYGCLLVETLSCAPPWPGLRRDELMMAVAIEGKSPPALAAVAERLPPATAALLQRCFAQNPKDRPTAVELLADLDHTRTIEPQAEPLTDAEIEVGVTSEMEPESEFQNTVVADIEDGAMDPDLPVFLNKVFADMLEAEEKMYFEQSGGESMFVDILRMDAADVVPIERLAILSECLITSETISGRSDAYPSVLILDLIEEEFSLEEFIELGENSIFDADDVIELIYAAEMKVLQGSTPIYRLTAVAFFRTLLRQLVSAVVSDINTKLDPKLLHAITAVMIKVDPINESMRNYYLKECKICGLSIPDLQAHCKENAVLLPWLDKFKWSSTADSDPGLGFNPFMFSPHFEETHTAIQRLIDFGDDRYLEDLVRKCVSASPAAIDQRVALLSGLAVCLLFPRTARQLTDKEHSTVAKLLEILRRGSSVAFSALPRIYRVAMQVILDGNLTALFESGAFDLARTSGERLLNSVILNMLIHVASMEQSVFTMYSSRPRSVAAHYLLAVQSEDAAIMRALAQGEGQQKNTKFTRYQCTCGFKYFVGECGQTMATGKCPSCAATIGGTNHTTVAGQTKLDATPGAFSSEDQPGFIAASNDHRAIGMHVRDMAPTCTVILDCLVHICIGLAETFAEEGRRDVEALVMGRVPDVVRHSREHIQACATRLKGLLGDCSEEEMAILLHAIVAELPVFCRQQERVLETAVKRKEWEAAFQNEMVTTRIASSFATTIQHFRETVAAVGEKISDSVSVLESQIDEMDKPPFEYCVRLSPRMFRVRTPKTFASLEAQFTGDHRAMQCYPFLRLFFEFEPMLKSISFSAAGTGELKSILFPIIQWTNLVRDRLGHRITQVNEAEMTVREFLSGSRRQYFSGTEKDAATQTFCNFEQAWNTLREQKFLEREQLECRALPNGGRMEKMTLDSSIFLSCMAKKDSGAWVYLAVQKLAGIQNEFLQRVMEQAAQPNCMGALCFYQKEGSNGAAGRQAVCDIRDVQRVLSHELVKYSWHDKHLQHGDNELEYGRGMHLRYNFAKIEIQLAKNHLFGCMHLDTSDECIVPFEFSDTDDNDQYGVLHDVACVIPQEPIAKSSISNILEHQLLATTESKTKVLESILVVANSLSRRYTNLDKPDPTLKLVKHVHDWMTHQIDNSVLEIFQGTFIAALPITNVVALHDDIEASISGTLIHSGTKQMFMADLTPDARTELEIAVGASEQRGMVDAMERAFISIADLTKALRCFVVRYLSREDFGDKTQPLAFYLAIAKRWPPCEFSARMNTPIPTPPDEVVETHWDQWAGEVDPVFGAENFEPSEHAPLGRALLLEHAYEAVEHLEQLMAGHTSDDGGAAPLASQLGGSTATAQIRETVKSEKRRRRRGRGNDVIE